MGPQLQWSTLTGGRVQCSGLLLLQKCLLSFPSTQFSMTPVSRLSQSPGAGLRQGLSALLHNHPFFLPPCHLAVITQPCLLPLSFALTYTVPYLCCKYNIKLSRESLVCLVLPYTDSWGPLVTPRDSLGFVSDHPPPSTF